MSASTSGGVELTDDLLDRLAVEAGQGYDVDRLKERHVQPPDPPPAAGPRVTG